MPIGPLHCPEYVLTEDLVRRLQLKKREPDTPVAKPSPTGEQARYAVTRAALAYFLHLTKEAVAVGGAPLLQERVCTTDHEAWYLDQITAAGVVHTDADAGWITLTKAGIKLATAAGVECACLEMVPS